MALARVWQIFPLNGAGPQSVWGVDTLGKQTHLTLCPFPAGGFIRRVRVQGSFSYCVIDNAPTTTECRSETCASENITFGVWAGYDGTVIPSQTPPIDGTLDDRWVYWDQMTLSRIDQFHTQLPDDRWIATWTFPYNDNDSTSSRGPAAVDSEIVLSWGFTNDTYEPMRDTVPNLDAFYGFSMTWSVLMEIPV